MSLRLRQRTEPRDAFQWNGQPYPDWPTWVQSSCTQHGMALRHERQSGAQMVYIGEWLVKDLDGAVVFYTDDELWEEFERAA